MTYLQLTYLHLASVLPAFLIGTFLMLNRKGTHWHRSLGKVYMLLMLATAVTVLFMPAEIGPRWLNHFGFIHIFSCVVFFCIPKAYFAAKAGNTKTHKGNMIGVYCGGLLTAGSFALMPGRLLHTWLFS